MKGLTLWVSNKYMGGVDMLEQNINVSLSLRSRHWYIYIFWHTIILAVINTWLLYKTGLQSTECFQEKDTKQEAV